MSEETNVHIHVQFVTFVLKYIFSQSKSVQLTTLIK